MQKINSLYYLNKATYISDMSYFKQKLTKGAYYVKFISTNGVGTYGFSTRVHLNPTLKMNQVNNKQKKITGKTEENAHVAIYVNNKHVKMLQANSKGMYTYTYKKLKAKNKVKVIATNKYGGKTTKQLTVQSVKKK